MSFSLNEIEVTAKKAARGAGYPWGLAEEAGRATRWLCAQGLDGPAALAPLLDAGFAASLVDHAPQSLAGPWTVAHPLCPLITGAALSDCAATLPARVGPVMAPLLLLPFLASAARQIATPLSLSTDAITATTDGTGLALSGPMPGMANTVEIGPTAMPSVTQAQHSRARPDPTAWETLGRYAYRTYAPATEESRLKGAGAGLSDND